MYKLSERSQVQIPLKILKAMRFNEPLKLQEWISQVQVEQDRPDHVVHFHLRPRNKIKSRHLNQWLNATMIMLLSYWRRQIGIQMQLRWNIWQVQWLTHQITRQQHQQEVQDHENDQNIAKNESINPCTKIIKDIFTPTQTPTQKWKNWFSLSVPKKKWFNFDIISNDFWSSIIWAIQIQLSFGSKVTKIPELDQYIFNIIRRVINSDKRGKRLTVFQTLN